MNYLQALHKKYIAKDKQVPVEYYGNTGRLTRGVINRFWDGGGIQIATETGGLIDVMGINPERKAGLVNVCEWCLTTSSRAAYRIVVSDAEAVVEEDAEGISMMMSKFGELSKTVKDVTLYRVTALSNSDVSLISGFVCVNAKAVGQPFCGWLVLRDGKTEFCHDVSANAITLVEV